MKTNLKTFVEKIKEHAYKISMKNVTPYRYISNLEKESKEDEILDYIELITIDYILNGTIPSEEDKMYSIEFLTGKIDYLENLVETFGLTQKLGAFKAIGHNLDMLTLHTDVNYDLRSNEHQLNFNVVNLLNKLHTLSYIFYKMEE